MSWKIQDLPEKGSSAATHRNATRRLLKELDVWRREQVDERGVERLGPVGDEDLLHWEAVINGRGIGGGYDGTSCCLFAVLVVATVFATLFRSTQSRGGKR